MQTFCLSKPLYQTISRTTAPTGFSNCNPFSHESPSARDAGDSDNPTLRKVDIGVAFTVGANFEIKDKDGADKLSAPDAFSPTAYTMESLGNHISQGYPWMQGVLGGNGKRWKVNVKFADVLALDFDDGLTIEQAKAHPFIAVHSGLIIESASSTPEHNKFRIVFRLSHRLEGFEAVEAATKYLLHLFPDADQACKDACRFYFGASGKEPRLVDESARLPEAFPQDAQQWQAEEDRLFNERKAEQNRKWETLRATQSDDDQVELVKSALDTIAHRAKGDGRHAELVVMIGGILNELGTEGERLLSAWDAGQGEWGRPFDKFLQSVVRNQKQKATLGTLFHLAKKAGWHRPQNERVVDFSVKPTTPTKRPDTGAVGQQAEAKPKLSIKPSFEFSTGYLGEKFGALPTAEQEKIVLLGVQKGGGKTESTTRHCQSSAQKSDDITYRDALVTKKSREVGLGYRTDDHPGGISLCIDSAHPTSGAKFKAKEHAGRILVIDEAVSVANHGVFSSTCRKERGYIWPEIAARICDATDPNGTGQLILADADLDDRTVNFLLSFAHPDAPKPFYIRQKPQPKTGKVIRYDDPKKLLSTALVAAQKGENLWITVSGQTVDSAKGSINLEKYFTQKGIKTLRLDSQTIKQKGHPAYGFLSMGKEEQSSLLSQYQVVLATSAIESGVSVEIKNHYSAVYGMFTGVVKPSAARQALSRVRDFSIDRHVFAAEIGLPSSFIGNRETTAEGLMKSQAKKTLKLREKMAAACFTWGEDEQRPIVMNEVMAYWAEAAAEHNQQMLKYADCVFGGLVEEGWQVERAADAVVLEGLKKELNEVKSEQQAIRHEQIALADSISEEEASAIEQSQGFEEGDLEKLARHNLEKRYATTLISPELVRADAEGAYAGLKMLYLLTIGQPYETAHLAAEISSLKGQGDSVFSPDIDSKNKSGIRDMLHSIGINKLLKFNQKFWRGDKAVTRVWANVRSNRQEIEELLSIDLDKCKAIGGINKILAATIGTRLRNVGKERHDKKQVPVYQFDSLPFGDVLERWLDRDHRIASERGELTDYSVLLNGSKMPTTEQLLDDESQLDLECLLVEQPTTSRSPQKIARLTPEQALQTMKKSDLKTLIRSFLLDNLGNQTELAYLKWLPTTKAEPAHTPDAAIELAESDQLALANLMIRYGSYSSLAAQLDPSALSKIPAAALSRFAAIAA